MSTPPESPIPIRSGVAVCLACPQLRPWAQVVTVDHRATSQHLSLFWFEPGCPDHKLDHIMVLWHMTELLPPDRD